MSATLSTAGIFLRLALCRTSRIGLRPILRSVCMMLPCSTERPFCATQAVHLENRLVLVGTIQAQIFGHHGRGDPAQLRGEMIGYRFPAEITWRVNFSPNAQTRTHLIDSFGSLAEDRQGNPL